MSEEDIVLPDIEIGRYGLRTFRIRDDKLKSVVKSHTWASGVAVAECKNERVIVSFGGEEIETKHSAPAEACTCGIYATVNLNELIRQYRPYAQRCIAVIAAEGQTIIGDRGMRTAAARIVAYWHRDDDDAAKKAFSVCEGAKFFDDVSEVLAAYNFPEYGKWPLPPASTLSISQREVDRLTSLPGLTPGGKDAIRFALGYM